MNWLYYFPPTALLDPQNRNLFIQIDPYSLFTWENLHFMNNEF